MNSRQQKILESFQEKGYGVRVTAAVAARLLNVDKEVVHRNIAIGRILGAERVDFKQNTPTTIPLVEVARYAATRRLTQKEFDLLSPVDQLDYLEGILDLVADMKLTIADKRVEAVKKYLDFVGAQIAK